MVSFENQIKEKALSLGFSACGICCADNFETLPKHLNQWLENGFHASMNWMVNRKDQRSNPQALWPNVRSLIVLGMNYGNETNLLSLLNQKNKGIISIYAQNNDYHDIIKAKLKELAQWIIAKRPSELKVFVDTAPVMEKPIAEKAGLGWQGKHSNLVSRDFGSWLFLGVIFSEFDLNPDQAEKDHCGSCRACLDICPTKAFPAPYKVDANRCISYLTIEHKETIALEFRKAIGNRIYGCDDCLAVCPWNKFASFTVIEGFKPRNSLENNQLSRFLMLDDAEFRELFRKSPIKRIGRDRFIRNVLIAAGNSNDSSLIPLIEQLLNDPAPIIRAMAIWALSEIDLNTLKSHASLASQEHDQTVLSEWKLALG